MQTFGLIVIKPALRAIYPALTSQFIYLILSTSVVSVISATDLTAAANNTTKDVHRLRGLYAGEYGIYLLLTLTFSGLFRVVQRLVFNYPLGR